MPDVKIDITGSASGFSAAARKASADVNRLGVVTTAATARMSAGLAVVGRQFLAYFAIAAIISRVMRILDDAGKVRDQSLFSVERYQRVEYAAKQTGKSIESFSMAHRMLAQAQIKALSGSKDQLEAFNRQGISVDDLKKKNANQLYDQMSERLKGATINSLKLSDAMILLGARSAEDVLPAMVEGFGDIMAEARVMSDQTVEDLAAIGDELTDLGQWMKVTFSGVFLEIVQGMRTALYAVKAEVGSIAAFWGTLAGGGTLSQAANASQAVIDAEAQSAADAETKLIEAAAARKRRAEAPPVELPGLGPTSTIKAAQMQVDALRRIGGNVGGSGASPELRAIREIAVNAKRQTRLLDDIKTVARDIA